MSVQIHIYRNGCLPAGLSRPLRHKIFPSPETMNSTLP